MWEARNCPPDWVAEILSPNTEERDRGSKMELFAREGVPHVWLIDPVAETLEVFRRTGAGYEAAARYTGATKVRAEPFGSIELDLSALWSR